MIGCSILGCKKRSERKYDEISFHTFPTDPVTLLKKAGTLQEVQNTDPFCPYEYVMKPYFGETRQFCQHPMFGVSAIYMYTYGSLGLFINLNHIRKHIGEIPESSDKSLSYDMMLLHDLKIIACSIGIIQYACLLIGCFSDNPALFLPHLLGQVIVFLAKFLNIILLLVQMNLKSLKKVQSIFASMVLMMFNWLQEFCVFRQILCICDL